MQTIGTIKNDAIIKLNEAKRICFVANQNLADSFDQLARKEKLTLELSFIVKSLRNHLRIFESLKRSVSLCISDVSRKKSLYFVESKQKINRLEKIYDQMKSIKVDPSLCVTKNCNENRTLYDYINNDHISDIISKMDNHFVLIDSLVDSKIMENIIVRFQNESNYLYNEWESINSFYQKYFIRKENEKELDGLVKNNTELEAEIIDILKDLNTHLDNCINYELQNSKNDAFYDLMQKQSAQKAASMDILQSNCDIISQNCKDIEKFVSIFEDFRNKLIKCFKEIKDFSANVLEKQVQNNLLKITREIKAHFDTLNDYKEDIIQFSEDSLDFIDSYYYLVLEVDRRCALNKKVQNLINDFESELKTLQENDSIKRNQFMSDHAAFLPQNLADFDIINSKFPQLELSYTLENLPSLRKSIVEESINKLKASHTDIR
ncbi:hypothetical protein PICMEDRAFT_75262 [Pichia membranifaciens NRRL Y-2026]|uniref:Autophagy-related protein 17 n=1 Tax=Pichia membranifaciens NRRL Y-2026 TaxID=763406 RepID=A0A1E3NSE2_9ASCO|nr:hypothetical protein PICMEDRAFT_75262 [Pichia membranifaciens NRRL Y-2026]ODQ48598.1 hypothetical protein PICMEDRAFT_75262 [Pichia membranifaciens NRRL Y-2026]